MSPAVFIALGVVVLIAGWAVLEARSDKHDPTGKRFRRDDQHGEHGGWWLWELLRSGEDKDASPTPAQDDDGASDDDAWVWEDPRSLLVFCTMIATGVVAFAVLDWSYWAALALMIGAMTVAWAIGRLLWGPEDKPPAPRWRRR